jgi:hypothetical protein
LHGHDAGAEVPAYLRSNGNDNGQEATAKATTTARKQRQRQGKNAKVAKVYAKVAKESDRG